MASVSQVTNFSVSGARSAIIAYAFGGRSDIFRGVLVVTASPQGTLGGPRGLLAVSSASPHSVFIHNGTATSSTDWVLISSA